MPYDWKNICHQESNLKTIVVANQKGGVGKTTVCINLAVQALQSTKKKIALLDLDPQRSLQTWFALRTENRVSASKRLTLLESSKADFALELERLRDDGYWAWQSGESPCCADEFLPGRDHGG